MNRTEIIIPTTQVRNAGYEFEVIDTNRLDHFHVRCVTNTLYDNNIKGSQLDGYRVEITLMDAESLIFLNSMNLYANFTESNRANNGMKRIKSARFDNHLYYSEQESWFKSILKQNKIQVTYPDGVSRAKLPTYYTCGLRLSNVRRSADKACGMLLLDENKKPKIYAFAIGKLRYVISAYDKKLNQNCPAQIGRKTVDVIECIDYNDEDDWSDEHDLENAHQNMTIPDVSDLDKVLMSLDDEL
ncbi:hypothetical protein NVP1081O_295 [Vibrio phage 1.081.O._10N.286.52.C2]|nr:hypothetical protein NVP1081O_295 [Vibrio phage 1.081.O._10N.286.52.C2]